MLGEKMSYTFTENDIKKVNELLDCQPLATGNSWSWNISNEKNKQSLVLTINNNVQLGDEDTGSLISVQTLYGYYELHNCKGFLIFEPGEVIFINESGGLVSSLIIGKECTCSMYSDIRREILTADYATLDPVVLLSAMQLSLAEDLLS
jgi:hypothetical protein